MADDAVRRLLTAKADALVRRAPTELAVLIHPDFVYVNAGGVHFDKAAYVDTYCSSGKVVFLSQRFDVLEVTRFPGFLVATMTLQDRFDAGGREIQAAYRSLGVFAEVDGKLLWAAGQTMSLG